MANPKEMATKKDWDGLFNLAHESGVKAGNAHTPTPFRAVQRANPFDDNSPITRDYGVVSEGLCGFAWVTIKPATSSFARWLKSNGKARSAYGGGISVWVSLFGQSHERKEKYAQAFAGVLKEAGITAYADSRLD